MALQTFLNNMGLLVRSYFMLPVNSVSFTTVDAVGESAAYIGKIFLQGGAGSKTISSAGGQIWFEMASMTWASSTTKIRVGIQDVTAAGVEDGTYDVYKECTGATSDLVTSSLNKVPMVTGSKTINHGDLIAVVFEMTARGGSDKIAPAYFTTSGDWNAMHFPYGTGDTGSGPARKQGHGPVTIVFDDGTIGWFPPIFIPQGLRTFPSLLTYNTGSNPDEYAAMFKFPFKCSVRGFGLWLANIGAFDTFDIILYSDPLGTPVAQFTYRPDVDYNAGTTSRGMHDVEITSQVLEANTWYAVALRPRSANSVSLGYFNFAAGGEVYKSGSPFGTNIKLVGRQNLSGAFSEVQNYYLPLLDLLIDKLDDGVQTGGGGASSYVF